MSAESEKPEEKRVEAGQTAPQIKVDDSKAHACYTNFCRVTGTPEEFSALIKSDLQAYAKLIQEAKIPAQ